MEKIQVSAQGREIDVEVYAPAGDEPAPGILVLHELFGLLDVYRQDAEDLARRGYLVYLPDLFTGGAARYCIRALVSAAARRNESITGPNQEVHDLLDSLKYDKRCNGRLGMIGMCLTGGFVLHMAKREDMDAPVVYHHSLGLQGSGIPKNDSLEEVRLMQGHWARVDPMCPRKRRQALKTELGDRLEAYEYDMPHGFRSVSRKLKDSKLVWDRTLDFFERQLKVA